MKNSGGAVVGFEADAEKLSWIELEPCRAERLSWNHLRELARARATWEVLPPFFKEEITKMAETKTVKHFKFLTLYITYMDYPDPVIRRASCFLMCM